jgi:hypothetical protein
MTIQEKAAEFARHFETRTRDNGDTFVCCTDDAPQELKDLVHTTHAIHATHGGMLPDDWRYQFVSDALDLLADCENPDDADPEVDIYTYDLTAWLHSRVDRVYYLTEALEAGSINDGFALLSYAQYLERCEVLNSVRSSLENLIEEEEA